MRLVVNSNRIIASLIKNSYSRRIILHGKLDLLTINISEKEIQKYREYILKKSKITETQFNFILEKIKEKMTLLDDKIIESKMKEAKNIISHIDDNDAPFIAAALATESDIWSDDKHFEKQKKQKI